MSQTPFVTHGLSRSAQETGFTLVEVLVALFVLAVGLLGLAMLQTTGLRFNTNSYSRTQATYLAYDIIERIRANDFSAFNTGLYDVNNIGAANGVIGSAAYTCNTTHTCVCDTGPCNSTALATYDLGQWYYRQDTLLTGAKDAGNLSSGAKRATIVRNGNQVTITMYWVEQENNTLTPRSQAWQVEIYP